MSTLGGGGVQSWVRIINCVLPSFVQTRKRPAQIFFSLSHILSMAVFPVILKSSFLNWTCARLKILVIFIPGVNFALSFMLALNYTFPWSLPIKRSLEMINYFFSLFAHHIGYLKGKNKFILSIPDVNMLLFYTFLFIVFISSVLYIHIPCFYIMHCFFG